MKKGEFIVFEGGLGAGKTTMVNKLQEEELRGWHFLREPGGTLFGEKMREAVIETIGKEKEGFFVDPYAELFTFAASRANLVRGLIIPALESGANIALDRYWYSTYAYQGAVGVSKLAIWAVNIVATSGLKPNLVLHYDLAPELGMERKNGKQDIDRLDLKDLKYHQEVRRNYHQLKRLYPGIWRTVDASQEIEAVYSDSVKFLQETGLVPSVVGLGHG